MHSRPQVTRFAPSPTGALHLGNARTALLNDLLARSSGGRMVLRIEDTDAERSDERLLERLLEDLRWFGLGWAEGPDVGGPRGPYRQSQRAADYDRAVAALEARGFVYPCFCSPQTLDLARRAQLAASRPPRYAGTCASLPAAEIARRVEGGARPAHRFRVPAGRVVEFHDLIHGPQRFSSDDIGDFVIRRADGSVAFFLGNALDDAAMEVTVVLRGDDHLANTPRQILLLEALGLPAPSYGHLPLLLGPGGAPLSKRDGAASLHDLRLEGYLPGALRNYLVRLGHACVREGWLETDDMAADLDLGRSGRSAPHFDEVQLRHWQREAVGRATEAALATWLEPRLERVGDRDRRLAFIAAVRGNLLFPSDADALVAMVCDPHVMPDADAAREIGSAGPAFFECAAAASASGVTDFKSWTRAVGAETGRRGAGLFMPLRAALTGQIHGPELAPLASLMGSERVAERLRAAGAIAAAG